MKVRWSTPALRDLDAIGGSRLRLVQSLAPSLARLRSRHRDDLRHDLPRQRHSAHAAHRKPIDGVTTHGIEQALRSAQLRNSGEYNFETLIQRRNSLALARSNSAC